MRRRLIKDKRCCKTCAVPKCYYKKQDRINVCSLWVSEHGDTYYGYAYKLRHKLYRLEEKHGTNILMILFYKLIEIGIVALFIAAIIVMFI